MRHVPPLAFGEPYTLCILAVDRGLNNRSYQYIVAEHILVLVSVCLVGLGIVIIHGAHNARVGCGVCSEYGREHSELHPAQQQFGVVNHLLLLCLVAAEVMTPVAVTYVRRSSSEIRLECKCWIVDVGVAGEANLIAVAAQTTPSVVNHRTAVGTVLVHFIKEHMVAPEGLTQVGSMLAGKPLLPIEPPEVHALFLFGTDNGVEKCLGEIGAVEYPLDTLRTVLGLHIFAAEHQVHVAEVFGRLIFLNTVGRMQIQCTTIRSSRLCLPTGCFCYRSSASPCPE